MKLSKNALGNLINRYTAVLKKCNLLNAFGSLAVAGMLVLGGAGFAMADSGVNWSSNDSGASWHAKVDTDGDFAGIVSDSGDASNANVLIDTNRPTKNFYGGYAKSGKATNNKLGVINASVLLIYGGGALSSGTEATDNHVTFSKATAVQIVGGIADQNASKNSVILSDHSTSPLVYGGWSKNAGNATNNTVTIIDSNVSDRVYGGYAEGTGNADNNTVTIFNSTIGKVYGGCVRDNSTSTGTATNNHVILSGATIGSVNGGGGAYASDQFTGNTLTISGESTVSNVYGFQYFNFAIPETFPSSKPLLEATATVVFGSGSTPSEVKSVSIAGSRNVGDKFTLLQATNIAMGGTLNFAGKEITENKTQVEGKTADGTFMYSLYFDDAANRHHLYAEILEVLKLVGSDFGNKLGGELGSMFNDAFASGEVQPSFANNYSKAAGVRFLARAINESYGNSSTEAAKTVESVAQAAAIAAVPQMTMGANLAGVSAIAQRTTIGQPTGSLQSVAVDNASGLNSGDDISGLSAGNGYAKNGFAMWIMPLWQSNNGFGLKSGEFEMDTHSSIGGIAIGADYTIEQAIRLGLTFNIGGGYAEGSGDLAKTTNNMNFWGVGAYAGWMCDNFGLTADVNYTSTHNDIKQEMDPSFRMQDMETDIMASAISAGLRAEYKFNTEALDIIPHVGVRYMHLTTYGYDMESAGETVLEASASHQNIWTFPIGVQFAKSFDMNNGWYVRPSLDLNVTPAAGDIDVKREVRFTGVTASANPETQTMDWITYGGQAGLEFGNDNMKLGVNYNLQAGAHTTNHGVFGTLRYEF